MCLNHPKTTPRSQVHGKIAFHKTDPWCKKELGIIGENSASLGIIQGVLLQRCATNIFTITLMKCLYLKPITAALVQTTGFRMEKVVIMSLKAGHSGTLVERIVGRRALIFCK